MFSKRLLEITVFTCGAMVMIWELVGSRVLGPYLGTSIYVWTSLIGVIMGSLSLGYWYGGKLADRNANFKNLSSIIFAAGIFIIIINVFKEDVMNSVIMVNADLSTRSLIASILIFFIPSTFLGMVSPYAAKLKISDLKNSGATIGNLYALSTLGSIVGTFMAGYWLIPSFGTQKIIYAIGIILVVNAILLSLKNHLFFKTSIFLIVLGLALISPKNLDNKLVADIDSMYSRIWVYETTYGTENKKIRALLTDSESIQSAMFLDSNELVFDYTKYYRLSSYYNKNIKDALVIGGAGFSYPKDFLNKFPEANLDVVEIDPKMTEIAKKYFNLEDNPRLTIYHEDGRVFLNSTTKKYDAIYVDAFSSITVPYQLTTFEAINNMKKALQPDGVIIVNTISSIDGQYNKFFVSEYKTFKACFSQVKVFPIMYPVDTYKRQNIILVATNSTEIDTGTSSDPEINLFLSREWKKQVYDLNGIILTDDYAPVDSYMKYAYVNY